MVKSSLFAENIWRIGSDPEKSPLNVWKALEWLVRNIYLMKNIEVSDRTLYLDRCLETRNLFSKFLSGHVLNAEQEEYLKAIITYVCQNGDIERSTLINEPPLNGYDWIETFGQHFVCIRDFVDKLHNTIIVA